MTKPPEIVATITGELDLNFHIPRMLKAHLASIGPHIDVRVDIKKWYKKRTNKQNAVAWGPDYNVIKLFLAEQAGESWSDGEIHDFHKKKFLGYEQSQLVKGLLKAKSTTDLDTHSFSVFREDYCRFWAGLGCYIPDPEKEE